MGRLVCGIVLLLSAVCFAQHQHTEHKSGSCPPVIALRQSNSTFTDSNSTKTRVPDECYTDSSCLFTHKCCNSSDGVFRCTHPIFQPTTTAATNVVKEGRCPFPLFGSTTACNDFNCTTDSDCYSSKKCCPSSTGQDHCSSCQSPIFDYYNRTTMKPYRFQPGICPENFNRYYEYYRHNENGDYANCPNHCNETRDCDEGELCCVPDEVEPQIYYDTPVWKRHADHQSNTPGCPVCKKAEMRCRSEYGTYYQDKELYQPSSDECTLCQCFEGFPHCYQVCDQDNYYGGRRGHWHAGWLPAGILSGVSLLISVIFSLSLCCCMKLCCNGKKNTIVVPQPPAMQVQAQVPPQYYYMAPATEDKIPLTDNGVSTA